MSCRFTVQLMLQYNVYALSSSVKSLCFTVQSSVIMSN